MVAASDRDGVIFSLSAGNGGDGPEGRALLQRLGPVDHPVSLLMDRAYEGDETRALAVELGYMPVVPPKSNRKNLWDYNKRLYKQRMWVGENESAKYWATILIGLRNRGVEDIFIACTDNLTGFSAAIEAVFPKTEVQNCIIHQIRNSIRYVSYKDLKALMADLKAVYAAVDETAALDALEVFAEHWDKKYHKISLSWRDNWPNLSTYFKYPQEICRLIYTTNAIGGFNRQLRKVTKAKSVFPTDDSLLKMLYLAMADITRKWTGRRQDWSMIHAQLAVYFEERMPD